MRRTKELLYACTLPNSGLNLISSHLAHFGMTDPEGFFDCSQCCATFWGVQFLRKVGQGSIPYYWHYFYSPSWIQSTLLLLFALVQVDTEVACFQLGPKPNMHIQQLDEQVSYSSEVWFSEHRWPSFLVKMSTLISLGSYARDMIIPQKFFVNMNS